MREQFLYFLKILGFVASLPLAAGTTISFFQQMDALTAYNQCFMWGVVTYAALHIFVYEPRTVFQIGRGLAAGIFKFSPLFSEIMKFILPLYTLVLLIGLYVLAQMIKISPAWIQVMVFSVGLFAAMHIVLTARELYEEDTSLLKPHYFLVTGWVHVFVLALVAAGLSVSFKEFSLVEFFRAAAKITVGVYVDAFTQLFAVKG